MSVRASASRPSSCSGGMYWNVPRIAPSRVSGCPCVGNAESSDRSTFCLAGSNFARPEVEELRARRGEHDIAGLEIAMDDALTVRFVERVGDLDAVAKRFVLRERAALEPGAERLAFEVLP